MSEPNHLPATPASRMRTVLTRLGLVAVIAILLVPAGALVNGHGFSSAVAPVGVPHAASTVAARAAAPAHPGPSTVLAHLISQGLGAHPVPAETSASSVLGQLRSAALQSAEPLQSSTASNYFVTGSDCASLGVLKITAFPAPQSFGGATIAQAGPSNRSLVVGGGNLLSLFNTSGGSPCNNAVAINPWVLTHGMAAAWESTDGGQNWQLNFPNLAANWVNSSGSTNNSLTWGPSVVASAPDNMTYDAFLYISQCFWVGLNCPTSNTSDFPPWGVAVARSTNGGADWGTTTQLRAANPASYYTFPSNCTTFPNGLYINNIVEKPWVTTNGSYAVVGWDVLHADLSPANCAFYGYQATVQISYTTNSGATWSSPVNLSGPLGQFVALADSVPSAHTVYAAFLDYENFSSSTGQISIGWTKSTNGGGTWTSPRDAVTIGVDQISSIAPTSPDAFFAVTMPSLAVDNWSGSPHVGNLYIAWSDNQTGTSQGYPAIDFVRSVNGGITWTTPTIVSLPGTNPIYVDPTVSVGPDGTVWISYYGIGTGSGNYNVYGIFSTDGGATWSPQFLITDGASTPGTAITDIGLNMGSVASTGMLTPVWTDCRSSNCYGAGDTTLFVAHVNPINISSTSLNAPTASVTTYGSTTSYLLPVHLGWDTGSSQTVQVPNSLPYNSTYVDMFQGWSGATTSTNFRATFTYTGGPSLVANYAPVPAAFLSGYVTPNPTGLVLTVDGTPEPVAPYNTTSGFYYVPVASGVSYYVNVSAPGYQPQWTLEPTSPKQTAWHNFTLLRVTGTVAGTVYPASAHVTVGAITAPVTVTSGVASYTLSVPWGYYWVNATATGYSNFSQLELIQPSVVTTVNIALSPGWIYGVVKSPVPATNVKVRLNGAQVNLTGAGTFNVSRPGGTYSLTATQAGYNLVVLSSIVVQPGRTSLVNITLTNKGWINGTIGPAAALHGLEILMTNGTLGGAQTYNSASGAYNVTLLGAKSWTVKVTSPGYNASTTVVPVSAGNVSYLNVTLTKAPCVGSSCTGNNNSNNTNNTKGGGGGASSPLGLTTILLIVVIVVLAGVLAAVFLMRRKGSAPPPEQPTAEEPDQTYQATPTSQLPHLQSDGSMGGPPENP